MGSTGISNNQSINHPTNSHCPHSALVATHTLPLSYTPLFPYTSSTSSTTLTTGIPEWIETEIISSRILEGPLQTGWPTRLWTEKLKFNPLKHTNLFLYSTPNPILPPPSLVSVASSSSTSSRLPYPLFQSLPLTLSSAAYPSIQFPSPRKYSV